MRIKKTLITISMVIILVLAIMPVIPVAAAGVISYAATSPTSGPVGTFVYINGSGFTAGSTYTIYFDGVSTGYGGVATGGSFSSAAFTVPPAGSGARNIQVKTTAGVGDDSNLLSFTVTPDITLSPTSGIVGSPVNISGTGFTPGTQIFGVLFGSASVTVSATVGNNGSFASSSFGVPAQPRGSKQVTVTAGVSASDYFSITPSIVLAASSGSAGDSIGISGYGFTASTTATIYFDNVSAGTANTNSDGTFTNATFTVPSVGRGTHTVYASDGYTPNSQTETFTIATKITVTPLTGKAGDTLTITGNGFATNSPLSFFIDNNPVTASITTTSSTGTFTATTTIPPLAYGSHALRVQDASSFTATVNFTTTQTITIAPSSGKTRDNITVTGKGFGASLPITITYDNQQMTTSTTSDANGNFTASFSSPGGAAGTHVVSASDGVVSSTANFTVTPTFEPPANRQGKIGDNISFSGISFLPSRSVSIRWDNTSIAQVTSDATGSFRATIKVPATKAGAHEVLVSDGTNTERFTYTTTSSSTVTAEGYSGTGPISGRVGTDITVSGEGFTPAGTINVTYDGTRIATATVDQNAKFTVLFKVPSSKSGSHDIIASDGTNTLTYTFIMESTPPLVPLLLQPQNNTKGDPLQEFLWTGVSDPSIPVTYSFQLATDSTFSNVIVTKAGLTEPGYKISEIEELEPASKDKPYYWRVKAIDGASNESAWSSASSFYIGFVLPPWGLYTIFGVVVIVVGLLCFWLGVRTTRARYGGEI